MMHEEFIRLTSDARPCGHKGNPLLWRHDCEECARAEYLGWAQAFGCVTIEDNASNQDGKVSK